MKIFIYIVIALLIGLGILMWFNSKPINKNQASESIKALLKKEVSKKDHVTQGLILVASKEKGYREVFTEGTMDENQHFHVASIGKTFTATLVMQLVEEKVINLDDSIINYLEEETLDKLFVYDDIDYKDQVTIRQLLNHTSGINDYFEGEVFNSKALKDLILESPNQFWTPKDLIDFSRHHQMAVGKPGNQYYYSDTGYILLGMIIENVTNQTFAEVLATRIFIPLDMEDSYLLFYDHNRITRESFADVWLDGVNIKDYQSLSIDWSGGGIISTLTDLEKFIVGLNSGQLVKTDTLKSMYTFDYKFENGIHYGLGTMELRFKEFFPTLGFLNNMQGHMGVLGTNMFYDQESELLYIASFGSTDYTVDSIKTMIKVLSTVSRIKN